MDEFDEIVNRMWEHERPHAERRARWRQARLLLVVVALVAIIVVFLWLGAGATQ